MYNQEKLLCIIQKQKSEIEGLKKTISRLEKDVKRYKVEAKRAIDQVGDITSKFEIDNEFNMFETSIQTNLPLFKTQFMTVDDLTLNPLAKEDSSQVQLHLPNSRHLHDSIQSDNKMQMDKTVSKMSVDTKLESKKKFKMIELKKENQHLKDTLKHYRKLINTSLMN